MSAIGCTYRNGRCRPAPRVYLGGPLQLASMQGERSESSWSTHSLQTSPSNPHANGELDQVAKFKRYRCARGRRSMHLPNILHVPASLDAAAVAQERKNIRLHGPAGRQPARHKWLRQKCGSAKLDAPAHMTRCIDANAVTAELISSPRKQTAD